MQVKTINLTHKFNKNTKEEVSAISNVSATISQGMSISIIGHTGSGKTTYIEHLNGLMVPTSGSVNLKYKINSNHKKIVKLNKRINKIKPGKKLNLLNKKVESLKTGSEIIEIEKNIKNSKRKIKNIKQIRKCIGVVFQFAEYQLFEETIEKDIMFGPLAMGMSKEEALQQTKKYLKIVGMPESFLKKSPFELSGGQKRRVALAGILAMEPDMLVLDEPTAGLDPQGAKEILDIFTLLNKKGKTIVIVTHNLDDALARTKTTMLFTQGKLMGFDDSYKILKDIDFLKQNFLEPPQIISFINILEKKGIKIPKVTNIEQLAKALNKI